MVRCGSMKLTSTKVLCLKEIGLHVCFKYANESRFISQHDWGGEGPHDHLMDRRIFDLRMTKIFIRAPKIRGQMDTKTMWSC